MIRTVTIGDLGKVITGNTPPRSMPDLYGTHTPFIKATDISEGSKYTYAPEEYYSAEGYQRYRSSLIPAGATCVVTIGSIGKKMTMAHCDCFINQAMNAVIPYQCFDNEYVYYAIRNSLGNLKSLDSGTASGRENVSKSAFSRMPVIINDDLHVQMKIGRILSAYDDLIENNQKQIKLLEEAAQRLYREWFVELRFPGHETTPVVDGVPEGWERVPMGSIVDYEIGGGWGEDEPTAKAEIAAYVIRGTDIYGITHGEMMNIPHRYHPASNLSSRKLQPGDIVFEVSGGSRTEGVAKTLLITDAMLKSWDKPVMCASFCKLMRFPTQMVAQYIFDMLQYMRSIGKTEEFEKKSASSIINYRWKDFLEQLDVLLPSTELLHRYAEAAGGLYNAIVVCSKKIEAAKKARDRLLPKLMSGEVEV